MDAIEPWAAVSDARMLHRQLRSSNSPRSPSSDRTLHSRSETSLGRSPGKHKRRGSGGSRSGLPAISSPEQTGTPAFAMLQAKTAVAQVRSLARLSTEKNDEIIKFGEHVNTELRALRRRMESQRQEDAKHETLEHRVAKAGGVVDDMREELSQLAQKRQKKSQLLVDLTDELRVVNASVASMSNSTADSPDAVRLGVVKAKYENVEADRLQMVEYSRTLDTLRRRARNACSSAQTDISQLQAVISDATGEIDSMRETLRLLQAVHVSTSNERNEYLKSLVMDKMAHAEQLKMRQQMISMERQVDIDNKKREEARVQALNRPQEKIRRKQLGEVAKVGFQKKALAKVREETTARRRALEGGMRRLEVETGITSAGDLLARWRQHGTMGAELQNTAVGTKRRLHEVQAEKERLGEELQSFALQEDQSGEQERHRMHGQTIAAGGSVAAMTSFEQQSALIQAAEEMVSERMAAAAKLEGLKVRVRESLLGLLLRVCPRETRSTRWAAEQWDQDPIDVINEIGMVVYAMGTEVCDGDMPTQAYVDSRIGDKSEWKSVIISNMQSDDFRKYNTRVAPINLRSPVLSEKAAHAPTAVVAEDHRDHLGRGQFKAGEILSRARAAGMIDGKPDKDPYGMRKGKKHKKHAQKNNAAVVSVADPPLSTEADVDGDPAQESSPQYVALAGPDFEV
jgi:hypothetical protein